jgi:excisionase family DNA binding protein
VTGEKLLTTNDVARYCQVSPVTVFRWIKSGELKAYTTPGGHHRIRQSDFRGFLIRRGMPIDEAFFSGRNSKRILVVDDEPDVLAVIARSLKRDAYELETAMNGFEAGMKLADFRPDLLILDLMMPRVDGFEVCELVHSIPAYSHVKILIVTGYASEENIARALEAGADDYLEKPLNIHELQQKVEALLS